MDFVIRDAINKPSASATWCWYWHSKLVTLLKTRLQYRCFILNFGNFSAWNSIKNETPVEVFLVNSANFLRKLFKNIYKRLLLIIWSFLANIRLDEDVFRLCLQKTSSKRLQNNLIKTNIFLLVTRLQEVLIKTNIFVLVTGLQDVFKTSSNLFIRTSSRHLQDVSKMYHQVKLFLLTRRQDVFETYSIRF